jgi:diguanylate cyclase (GGDEF)-like protein/PAS domain S-box-containing protein
MKPEQFQEEPWSLPSLGRPKATTHQYLQRLQELVNHSPEDYGYARKRWTGQLLKQQLATEFSIEVSDRHINRLLQQMGLSLRQRRQQAAVGNVRLSNANDSTKTKAVYSASTSICSEKQAGLDIVWASQEVADLRQVLATNSLLSTAIETVTDAIEITDSQAKYLYVNSAFEKVMGYARQEVIGRTPAALLRSGQHDEEFYREMFDTVCQGRVWQGLYTGRRKNGPLLNLDVTLSPILSETGTLTHIIAVKREIAQPQQTHKFLYSQAFYDHLTGLPNRILFQEQLTAALSNSQRHQRLLAVMFLNLDHFKQVNDRLGHAMGDPILQRITHRLKHYIRAGETLARWGENEFILLMPHLNHHKDAIQVARRILAALDTVLKVEGDCFHFSMNIGIAFYPQDGQDAETLLRNADTALYAAKAEGCNGFQCYCSSQKTGNSRITIVP